MPREEALRAALMPLRHDPNLRDGIDVRVCIDRECSPAVVYVVAGVEDERVPHGPRCHVAPLLATPEPSEPSVSVEADETETCPTCWQPVPVPQAGDQDYGIPLRASVAPPPLDVELRTLGEQWFEGVGPGPWYPSPRLGYPIVLDNPAGDSLFMDAPDAARLINRLSREYAHLAETHDD